MYKLTTNLDLFEKAIMMEFDNMPEYCPENYDYLKWVKDFRTISIQLPRQQGNSSLGVRIAKNFKNPFVITNNCNIKRRFENELGKRASTTDFYRDICGLTIDLFIFDGFGHFPKDFEIHIEPFIKTHNPKILRIGEI